MFYHPNLSLRCSKTKVVCNKSSKLFKHHSAAGRTLQELPNGNNTWKNSRASVHFRNTLVYSWKTKNALNCCLNYSRGCLMRWHQIVWLKSNSKKHQEQTSISHLIWVIQQQEEILPSVVLLLPQLLRQFNQRKKNWIQADLRNGMKKSKKLWITVIQCWRTHLK